MSVASFTPVNSRLIRTLLLAGASATFAASAFPAQAAHPRSHPRPHKVSHHVPVAHASGHKVG